jgi:hypothetical protein
VNKLFALTFGTLLLSALALHAADRPFPFHGKIFAVDQAAKTFTIPGKAARVFAVTDETKLTKGDAEATFEELQVGAEVRGLARKNPDGSLTAVSVKIGPKES